MWHVNVFVDPGVHNAYCSFMYGHRPSVRLFVSYVRVFCMASEIWSRIVFKNCNGDSGGRYWASRLYLVSFLFDFSISVYWFYFVVTLENQRYGCLAHEFQYYAEWWPFCAIIIKLFFFFAFFGIVMLVASKHFFFLSICVHLNM